MIIFKDKDLVYVAIPMGLHAYSNKSDVDYECKDNWDAFFTDDGTITVLTVLLILSSENANAIIATTFLPSFSTSCIPRMV